MSFQEKPGKGNGEITREIEREGEREG